MIEFTLGFFSGFIVGIIGIPYIMKWYLKRKLMRSLQ